MIKNLKFYAFDWDDNIMTMPTRIMLKDKDNNEVGISSKDFAKVRDKIGKENFILNGHEIIGYADNPFKNFRKENDKAFIIDAMLGTPAQSWYDFVECINHASIFSIITARGHSPQAFKEVIYNFIISNFNGINMNMVLDNIENYRDLFQNENLSDMEKIKFYIDLCKFYPVSYDSPNEMNPELLKVQALEEFTDYVNKLSNILKKKPFLKKKIANNFIPTIGFSDDDEKNVEAIKQHFSNKNKDFKVKDNGRVLVFNTKNLPESVERLIKTKILKIINEQNNTVKDGVMEVFQNNPELAELGTPEQYSEYLDTIFPNSKFKQIFYHNSPNKFEKFRENYFGIYFSFTPLKDVYGSVSYSVVLDAKQPLIIPQKDDSFDVKDEYAKKYRKYLDPTSFTPEGFPVYEFDSSVEPSSVAKEGKQIRVRNPDQVHILGSKQDIEGFKKFVSS
jgi:hypothetical protein